MCTKKKGRPVLKRIVMPEGIYNVMKKAGLYLCHRYSGAKLGEIGSYFDMKDVAVSQASRRFARHIEKNRVKEDIEAYRRKVEDVIC